jgi:hypothetical protein
VLQSPLAVVCTHLYHTLYLRCLSSGGVVLEFGVVDGEERSVVAGIFEGVYETDEGLDGVGT